ncbi:hypothetical protein [Microlunatus speluncae]|uniref:hypothetical protein n=1 Tax=Microlunatus speluncae TaxID=2594267 RepID=UPI001266756A|nr:hypothetical protein [Microlunatus speluncae]
MPSSTPVNGADLAARSRLFHPGERLGWVFRDRTRFARPFAEEQPAPPTIPLHLVSGPERIDTSFKNTKTLALVLFWVGGILSLVLGIYNALAVPGGDFWRFLLGGLLITAIATVAVLIFASYRRRTKIKAIDSGKEQHLRNCDQQYEEWVGRGADWEQTERVRVDQLPEWGAATTPPETRRLDIFGGNLWAWQAFLTVYGTSALAQHPVIMLDLSREIVSEELARTADAAGVPVDAQLLPDQLTTTTLLSDLSGTQIVDAVIESMYADDDASSRSERTIDHRFLTAIADQLGDTFTLARLAAGLRALMDQSDVDGVLSAKEQNHLADELFSVDLRRHSADRLQRLESYLQPLQRLGSQGVDSRPGYLTCMALASDANNVHSEFLTDLLVQWLTHRIVGDYYLTKPEVIIVGADSIKLRHLERLSDACERRGIRITMMFRNLRGDAENFIGRGLAGFMRLGNATEAGRAADHIGREHKFVVSQLTATLGGNETHTTGDSSGSAVAEGINVSTSAGWTKNWTKGRNATFRDGEWGPTDTSKNKSFGRTESETTSEGKNFSETRNWSVTRSFAEGTNWTNANTNQRVQEYVVEPVVLQNLPDHLMLVVEPQRGRQANLVPVEFDPAIVTLPGVSMEPLTATPEPVEAQHRIAADDEEQRSAGAGDQPAALTSELSQPFGFDDTDVATFLDAPEPAAEPEPYPFPRDQRRDAE